ncbi:MAG TPA: hypothetical protein VGA77_06710 [Propylenella sp.]
MATKAIFRAAGALAVLGPLVMPAAALAGAPSFPSAVEQILMSRQDGPVAKLTPDRKRALVVCVNDVLAGLPNGKKRFVIEAADFGELEDRFGKVVMENRAEWKQKIAKGCAHLAI